MKTKKTDLIMQDKAFVWVGYGTGIFLLVLFLIKHFQIALPDPGGAPGTLNWSLFDFLAMGVLVFGMGSVFVLLARKFKANRVLLAILILIAFLLIWAQLAVGIVDTWPFAGN